MKLPLLVKETAAPVLSDTVKAPENCARKVPLLMMLAPFRQMISTPNPVKVAVCPAGFTRVLPSRINSVSSPAIPPLAVTVPVPMSSAVLRVVSPLTVMSAVPAPCQLVLIRDGECQGRGGDRVGAEVDGSAVDHDRGDHAGRSLEGRVEVGGGVRWRACWAPINVLPTPRTGPLKFTVADPRRVVPVTL